MFTVHTLYCASALVNVGEQAARARVHAARRAHYQYCTSCPFFPAPAITSNRVTSKLSSIAAKYMGTDTHVVRRLMGNSGREEEERKEETDKTRRQTEDVACGTSVSHV